MHKTRCSQQNLRGETSISAKSLCSIQVLLFLNCIHEHVTIEQAILEQFTLNSVLSTVRTKSMSKLADLEPFYLSSNCRRDEPEQKLSCSCSAKLI